MTTATASPLTDLKRKMETREARIGIVGMGYVGLPLALLFSGERFRVTGFDIEAGKVSALNAGGSYIVRILPSEIQAAQKAGFRATADYSQIAQMDAVIIAVPTPLNEYHEPDLSYVTGTVESIAPYIHEGQLIVLESTTYPGTTEEIVVPLLEKPAIRLASRWRATLARTRRARGLLPGARGPRQRDRGPARYSQGGRRLRTRGPPSWPRPCTEPSSAAWCPSAAPRPRR